MNYTIPFLDTRLKSVTSTAILTLFICISNTFSQNTTIVFNTKPNTTLGISKEIDNTYTRMLTDEIETDSTGSYTYSLDVDEFQFVNCTFYGGAFVFFPITQGSHLIITYKGDFQFEYAGTDKAEAEFYKMSYKKEIVRPYLDSLFDPSGEHTLESLLLLFEKYDVALTNLLDSLVTEQTITLKYSDIIKNDFYTLTVCTGIGVCRARANEKNIVEVENIENGILDKIVPLIESKDILKYNLGSSASAIYYNNKYKHLEEKDKDKLLSENLWTSHISPNKLGYLIAPKDIQYKLLSLELLDNYENVVIRGDSAFIDHISEIRPQTAFLPYIMEKRNELLLSLNEDISGVEYITQTIDNLESLSKIKDFDQKLLYIDFWATWCGPCIEEFKHRNKIHELLSNYPEITPVYISIDEDKNDAAWSEKTKAFNLNGYHLRANKELITYINEKLYDSKGIGIPRYILLGKDGNILENNLPRPSNIDQLKQELEKHLD